MNAGAVVMAHHPVRKKVLVFGGDSALIKPQPNVPLKEDIYQRIV